MAEKKPLCWRFRSCSSSGAVLVAVAGVNLSNSLMIPAGLHLKAEASREVLVSTFLALMKCSKNDDYMLCFP